MKVGEEENYLKEPIEGHKQELSKGVEKEQGDAPAKPVAKENKPTGVQEVRIVNHPKPREIQKVEITNLPKPEKPREIQFVKVTNPQDYPQPVDKEIQKVEVVNPPTDKEIQKVKIVNPNEFPETMEVSNLPTGVGDNPKKGADPSKYINVRLTNGKRFYMALEYAMAALGGGGGDKISPATIGEILNLSVPDNVWTQIQFSGEVIAFEVQCRTSANILITNTQDGARYITIKAGVAKSFTLRMTDKWWIKSVSGTVVVEVIGVR